MEVSVSTNGAVEWSTLTVSESGGATAGVSEGAGDGADTTDRVVFEYHPVPLLGSLDPPTGPAIGGTLVSVSLATSLWGDENISAGGTSPSSVEWQFSFDPIRDASAKCLFNGTVVPATVVSNTSVECVAPPTVSDGGVTFVTVSINGADMLHDNDASDGSENRVAGSALEFLYLPDEAEMMLFPASGPVKGGTLVEVSGRHIADAATALLLHQTSEDSSIGYEASSLKNATFLVRLPPSSVVCSFNSNNNVDGAATSAVAVTASGLSFHWDGVVDAYGRETGVGRVLCLSPPAPDNLPAQVAVQISLNGGKGFTNHGAQFFYRPEAYVFGVEPAYGPVTGDNPVRVEGSGFRDEGGPGGRSEMVLCRFGDQEVGATVHAAGLVSCRAPPMLAVPEQQEIEVQFNSGCFSAFWNCHMLAPGMKPIETPELVCVEVLVTSMTKICQLQALPEDSDLIRHSTCQVWTLAWAPEIQTISVQADAPVREVFSITTGSDEVLPEVQRVTVLHDDIDEIQTITTSQVGCTPSGRRECHVQTLSDDHDEYFLLIA